MGNVLSDPNETEPSGNVLSEPSGSTLDVSLKREVAPQGPYRALKPIAVARRAVGKRPGDIEMGDDDDLMPPSSSSSSSSSSSTGKRKRQPSAAAGDDDDDEKRPPKQALVADQEEQMRNLREQMRNLTIMKGQLRLNATTGVQAVSATHERANLLASMSRVEQMLRDNESSLTPETIESLELQLLRAADAYRNAVAAKQPLQTPEELMGVLAIYNAVQDEKKAPGLRFDPALARYLATFVDTHVCSPVTFAGVPPALKFSSLHAVGANRGGRKRIVIATDMGNELCVMSFEPAYRSQLQLRGRVMLPLSGPNALRNLNGCMCVGDNRAVVALDNDAWAVVEIGENELHATRHRGVEWFKDRMLYLSALSNTNDPDIVCSIARDAFFSFNIRTGEAHILPEYKIGASVTSLVFFQTSRKFFWSDSRDPAYSGNRFATQTDVCLTSAASELKESDTVRVFGPQRERLEVFPLYTEGTMHVGVASTDGNVYIFNEDGSLKTRHKSTAQVATYADYSGHVRRTFKTHHCADVTSKEDGYYKVDCENGQLFAFHCTNK